MQLPDSMASMHAVPTIRPRRLLALSLLIAAGAAAAHDTWFEQRAGGHAGDVRLVLGTGDQFPKYEFNVGAHGLVKKACRGGERTVAMRARETDTVLHLQASLPPRAARAITCWVELMPLQIEIEPREVLDSVGIFRTREPSKYNVARIARM